MTETSSPSWQPSNDEERNADYLGNTLKAALLNEAACSNPLIQFANAHVPKNLRLALMLRIITGEVTTWQGVVDSLLADAKALKACAGLLLRDPHPHAADRAQAMRRVLGIKDGPPSGDC